MCTRVMTAGVDLVIGMFNSMGRDTYHFMIERLVWVSKGLAQRGFMFLFSVIIRSWLSLSLVLDAL